MAIAALAGIQKLPMCPITSINKNPATMGNLGVQFFAIAPFFPIDATQRIAYNRINETQIRIKAMALDFETVVALFTIGASVVAIATGLTMVAIFLK